MEAAEVASSDDLGGSSDAGPPTPTGLRGAAASVSNRVRGAISRSGNDATEASPYAWSPKTLSVVLPCAGEGEYALKTVRAVFDTTPTDVLHEIIVVDDGTEPPLADSHLSAEVQTQYRVKIIRHKRTVGLIGAKQDGGMAATGDIITFFDCHVAPQSGWHKSFLRLVGENYRRIVVPRITDLDITTWTQRGGGGGQAKCYLTWDADFKWFESSDPYVPVLSGGLLGISRRWWNETRGYDDRMVGWGGENLDQSLRSWLCGGEIMIAEEAHVAHMWRTPSDPRTQAKYVVTANAAASNRMRAAVAWFGEFSEKLRQFPELQASRLDANGGPWYGDISNILAVREDLKCKSFAWFMHRFQHVYEDGGLIPRETFGLRAGGEKTMCLTYTGQAGTSPNGKGMAELRPCQKGDDRQRWHGANRDSSQTNQPCCSGLRAWNTDQCISGASGGVVHTFVCDISGRSSDQAWQFVNESGQLRQAGHFGGGQCIEVKAGSGSSSLQVESCRSNSDPVWTKDNALEPIESRLYRKARLNGFA